MKHIIIICTTALLITGAFIWHSIDHDQQECIRSLTKEGVLYDIAEWQCTDPDGYYEDFLKPQREWQEKRAKYNCTILSDTPECLDDDPDTPCFGTPAEAYHTKQDCENAGGHWQP